MGKSPGICSYPKRTFKVEERQVRRLRRLSLITARFDDACSSCLPQINSREEHLAEPKPGLRLFLAFFRELRGNNEREWFQANKGRYEKALAAFPAIVGELLRGFDRVSSIDLGKRISM
jgi:hypothetical protein